MRRSLNLNESFPSLQDSNDNSFDRSEDISTRSETKSFSSVSFFLEREQEMESFRSSNQRFSTTFLRRSLSHKRLTSPLMEKGKSRRKQNFVGLPVFEVKEEQEKEDQRKISKIKIIHDDEEFGTNHLSYSKSTRKTGTRCLRRGKSLDPLRLPKVEEAALQEEDQIKPLSNLLMKLDIFKDKNEFNTNLSKKLGFFIEKSQFLECSELPIEEELEKERPILDYGGLWSNVSSTNVSNYNSPRFKIKVDELDERRDIEKKRKFVFGEQQDNEIIEEEEKIDHEDRFSAFMKQSRKSMKEEKIYMKRIIKGEIIEEKDIIALNLDKEFVAGGYNLQPLEESEYEILSRSDSDSDKDLKNKGNYAELKILEATFD